MDIEILLGGIEAEIGAPPEFAGLLGYIPKLYFNIGSQARLGVRVTGGNSLLALSVAFGG
jgi:hypothetical protein